MKNQNLLFKVPGNKDLTIAVAFPFFWTGNSEKLFAGIRDTAEKYGLNLLFFHGYYCNQSLYPTREQYIADELGNIAYKLLQSGSIDGLIICTGGLKSHSEKVELINFCSVYNSKPIISIGSAVETIPNILVDNANPVKLVVQHLIDIHGKRKISFIRGPHNHTDSNERFSAYLSALQENGIEFNPEWIPECGTWNKEVAFKSTLDVMKKNNNSIDAFLCTNDNHAVGVIDALSTLNFSVPDQIAVIGFNNDAIAEASNPALTTIDRNLYGRGALAIKLLSDHFNGITINGNHVVDAPVVIRQSCGCLSKSAKALDSVFTTRRDSPLKITGSVDKIAIREQLKERILEAIKVPRSDKSQTWCKQLVDSFVANVTDKSRTDFLLTFDDIIHYYSQSGYDICNWHFALNILDLALEYFISESDFNYYRAMIHKARIHLSETSEQIQKSSLLKMEERNATINALNHAFNTTNDLNKILDLLARDLPKIGIPSFYLSLYEDPDEPLGFSKLMLAFNRTGRLTVPVGGVRFQSSQILPEEFIPLSQHKSFIFEPLYYGSNHIGFILFELGHEDNAFYELFPAELSAALWSSILNSNIEKTENMLRTQSDEIAKFNEALEERTSELEFAFEQIERNHDKLLMAEKMASLGRLTAGIAHEINTPLATVKASIMELESLVTEFDQSIDDKDITKDDLNHIIDDMNNSVELADRSIVHASSFLKSIQDQTGDKNAPEITEFDLYTIIHGVLTFLNHSIKQLGCKVSIVNDCSSIIVKGSAVKMTQVITNLLTNAIDAVESSATKTITINLNKDSDHATICISDTGCGIPEQNLAKIFEPLFTTKPFGRGTGLGLPIVKKIISEDFGGTVTVESECSTGTTFTVKLKTI